MSPLPKFEVMGSEVRAKGDIEWLKLPMVQSAHQG